MARLLLAFPRIAVQIALKLKLCYARSSELTRHQFGIISKGGNANAGGRERAGRERTIGNGLRSCHDCYGSTPSLRR